MEGIYWGSSGEQAELEAPGGHTGKDAQEATWRDQERNLKQRSSFSFESHLRMDGAKL